MGGIAAWISASVTAWPDYVGVAIFCFGALMLVTVAFQKSTGWGVAMLLFGWLLWPIFVLLNWKQTNYWFFFCLTGWLIVYIF
jgi:hypothetical protein